MKNYTIDDYQLNEEVHMRKIIFPIKSLLLALIFFSQLILPVSDRAFSQTTPENAAEQWSLRQTEIENFYQEGDLQGALNITQEAVSLAETAFGPASLEKISSMLLQAQIYSELDQLEEANQIYQAALETTVSTLGESDTTTLSVLDTYGQFLNSIDPEMAEPILTEALRLSENEDPQRAARMKALGQNLQEMGRNSEAEKMLNEALKIFQTLVGEKDVETLSAMSDLAQLQMSQGKLKPAQELFERALPLMLEVLEERSFLTLESKENLGEIYRQQGSFSQAEKLFQETINATTAEYGYEEPLVIQAKSHLAQLYEDTGKLKHFLRKP